MEASVVRMVSAPTLSTVESSVSLSSSESGIVPTLGSERTFAENASDNRNGPETPIKIDTFRHPFPRPSFGAYVAPGNDHNSMKLWLRTVWLCRQF